MNNIQLIQKLRCSHSLPENNSGLKANVVQTNVSSNLRITKTSDWYQYTAAKNILSYFWILFP